MVVEEQEWRFEGGLGAQGIIQELWVDDVDTALVCVWVLFFIVDGFGVEISCCAVILFFSLFFFSFVFLWFILVARYFKNLGNQIQLLVLFRRMRFAILMNDMCAILRRNHNHGALF